MRAGAVVARGLAVCALTVCGPHGGDPRGEPGVQSGRGDASALSARDLAELQATFHREHVAQRGATSAQFLSWHRPSYLPQHGLRVSDAGFHDGFVRAFSLSADQQRVLAELGFVVIPNPGCALSRPRRGRPAAVGPADLYYRVFAADLPVFITADSVLHAWHRSFDALSMQLESQRVLPALQRVLQRAGASLLPARGQAEADALLYVAVAQELLELPNRGAVSRAAGAPGLPSDSKSAGALPHHFAASVASIRNQIERGRVERMQWLGQTRIVDFGQFIPRGHYTESTALRAYFRAMTWLGAGEFILRDAEGASPPRHEAAARALASAVASSGALADLSEIEAILHALVGAPMAVGPVELLALCSTDQREGCTGSEPLRPGRYDVLPSPTYAARFEAATRGDLTFRLVTKRFAYDAWVMSRTTVPALGPVVKDARSMPSPLDVAFVLGSDRAAEHLAEDMGRPNRDGLPAVLEALRRTATLIPPASLRPSVYNHWLEALSSLAQPRTDPRLPSVMRTAPWHDRRLEAVLGSWAELRSDTILMVELSASGAGCQYPRGFVEPVPDTFRSIERAVAQMSSLLRGDSRLSPFFAHWQVTLARLAAIADRELSGQGLTADDLAFLNRTVDRHRVGYGGTRSYDGWYPALYWSPTWGEGDAGDEFGALPHSEAGKSKPVVTDVHADSDAMQSLHVGVGHPELLIVAIDAGGETSLHAGPVYSTFVLTTKLSERLTDSAWARWLEADPPPPRPAFASRYRAPNPTVAALR